MKKPGSARDQHSVDNIFGPLGEEPLDRAMTASEMDSYIKEHAPGMAATFAREADQGNSFSQTKFEDIKVRIKDMKDRISTQMLLSQVDFNDPSHLRQDEFERFFPFLTGQQRESLFQKYDTAGNDGMLSDEEFGNFYGIKT